MSIRIKDIASRAGVSRGTVDRVIHQRGNVAKHVQQKVENVIAELGYQRNIIASQLVSNKTLTIGIVLPHFSEDPYWNLPLAGIKQCFEEFKHFNIELNPSFFNLVHPQSFTDACQMVLDDEIDALITAPLFEHEANVLQQSAEHLSMPIVTINTPFKNQAAHNYYVGQNSYKSGLTAGRLFELSQQDEIRVLQLLIGSNLKQGIHFQLKAKGLYDYWEERNTFIHQFEIDNLSNNTYLKELILKEYEQHGPFNCIFIPNSKAYRFIEIMEGEMEESTTIIGFDLISENRECLTNKSLTFLLDQNPKLQGYTALKTMIDLLILEKSIPATQHVPHHIYIPENLR